MLIKQKNIDEICDLALTAFPQGDLYGNSDEFRNFLKGFLAPFLNFNKILDKNIEDQFKIDENSLRIQEFLTMYGLPNVIFPELTTLEDKVFAISMMKVARTLRSKGQWEGFMADLGYNVKFYSPNNTILEQSGFPYSFPISFTNTLGTKDKLTYWVWVEEATFDEEVEFFNLGDAFPLDFVETNNNLLKVKKILDYLKPDYLIFQYITSQTKNLYNL